MKKKKTKKIVTRRKRYMVRERIFLYFLLCVCSVTLIVVLVAAVVAVGRKNVKAESKLNGVFVYESATRYVFDGKGNGYLEIVGDEENVRYQYVYQIEGNQMYLEFETDTIGDAVYTFMLEGDRLFLIGKEGTLGGTYELIKQ